MSKVYTDSVTKILLKKNFLGVGSVGLIQIFCVLSKVLFDHR